FTIVSVVAAASVCVQVPNNGVHLAILPPCGTFGGNVTNVNAGIDTAAIKTLVAFGDSFTFGGRSDGGPLPAAVLTGTNPSAAGRATDGPVWAEDLASDLGATIKDYAVSGAVVDVTLWPSRAGGSDFLHQAALFLGQNNNLDPTTTLYTVFFGIKTDEDNSEVDGNHLPQAATELLAQIKQLVAPPTNAKNILVVDDYGRGVHAATGEAWKQAVFNGVSALRPQGVNVAYVDFAPLWDAVLGTSPGFAAFGYETSGSCIPAGGDLSAECSTPGNAFYWFSRHPSKETHRIMADYIKLVLATCEA
ncbi:hypothetical protein B0H13DRAFT_1589968, partial [Mycena leptocephala]